MMKRRSFLVWSGAIATCRPSFAAQDWRMGVGELRCGGVLADRACARRLAAALGVSVRPVSLGGEALIEAFHAGQIEFGRFDERLAAAVRALMGDRVICPLPGTFLLRSLPHALRADVTAALFKL